MGSALRAYEEAMKHPSLAILDGGINVANRYVRSGHHTLGDLLYRARNLADLSVGDGLAIMDSGAYFIPYPTCFSFPRPAVVMVDGPDVKLLRRAETFGDLVALDEAFCG